MSRVPCSLDQSVEPGLEVRRAEQVRPAGGAAHVHRIPHLVGGGLPFPVPEAIVAEALTTHRLGPASTHALGRPPELCRMSDAHCSPVVAVLDTAETSFCALSYPLLCLLSNICTILMTGFDGGRQ